MAPGATQDTPRGSVRRVSDVTDAVVPVAGLGTRLLPATRSQPKEMLPLVDRPVVQYVVEELVAAGIDRVLFVTGRRKRAIEDHFDADPELATGPLIDRRAGLQLLYTRQPRPAGLGDAVSHGAGLAPGRGVVVALGDAIITDTDPAAGPSLLARLIAAYGAPGVVAAVAVETVPTESVGRYGIVVPVDPGADGPTMDAGDLIEKPDPSEVDSRLAIAGRYVLGPEVFAALQDTAPDGTGEVQLTDALRAALHAGGRIIAVPLRPAERRHDIGTVQSYCEVFLELALRDERFGPALRERAAALLDATR
jgi:UTP--glucose-1-phosphate uridylyltransferase